MNYRIDLKNEDETVAFGRRLANALMGGGTVFMSGTLGAGKTTTTRGILYGFGHSGAVKSPTYTLVEPYELQNQKVFHFDLYRLGDPEELEYIGIRDYFSEGSVCIVEWPSKGEAYLPSADVEVVLTVIAQGRSAVVEAKSAKGEIIIATLGSL